LTKNIVSQLKSILKRSLFISYIQKTVIWYNDESVNIVLQLFYSFQCLKEIDKKKYGA